MTKDEIKMELELVQSFLAQGIFGYETDPSWMRPIRLPQSRRDERILQSYHRVKRILTEWDSK
jgi:hypothetical protein